MKPVAFMVVTQDSWGKGKTLPDAAENCRKAGGCRTHAIALHLFIPKDENAFHALTEAEKTALYEGITFTPSGYYEYPSSLVNISAISPDSIRLSHMPKPPKIPKRPKS